MPRRLRLSEATTEQIKLLWVGGDSTQAQIAAMFGVSQATVSNICKGLAQAPRRAPGPTASGDAAFPRAKEWTDAELDRVYEIACAEHHIWQTDMAEREKGFAIAMQNMPPDWPAEAKVGYETYARHLWFKFKPDPVWLAARMRDYAEADQQIRNGIAEGALSMARYRGASGVE